MKLAIVALMGLVVAALPALGREKEKEKVPADVQKSIDTIRRHVDTLPNGMGAGEVTAQLAPAVKEVFPEYHMIVVKFRLFPVARIMPEGLRAANIFAVNKDGKYEHLKDAKTLEKFFRAHQPAAKDEKTAKKVLAAWLTLTPEFHQDNMFKFEVMDKEFSHEDNKVSGRAMVTGGGNGQLSVVLMLDKDGKLAKVEEKAAIRPGPRPICQATKLLDADPIVRRMAEQDLLIMGLSARDYVMEQRGRATPELRDAIDRLWQRIQKNGW